METLAGIQAWNTQGKAHILAHLDDFAKKAKSND